jgi:uncharacterized protein involved in exopolysaccharide biosynthesis
MPALENTKHEAFARERAKGETIDASYVTAGYKRNRGNAAALNAKQYIQDRIAELQAKAAEKCELTIADLVKELEEARGVALKAETPQSSAAVSATMGKAKLLGLVVDKTEGSATLRVIAATATDERI